MKQTVLKYGLYGCLTGFFIFIVHLVIGIENFDYATNEILGYASIFISLSFIYFGIKHYRDRVNNGVISLSKALVIGVLISILVGVGIAIADYVYTTFINPSFFKDFEQALIEQGKTDDIFEMTSTTAAIFMLVLVTIIGFIISLISAFILQRK